MNENHQTFKFTFSGRLKQAQVFPKEQLTLASKATLESAGYVEVKDWE